MPASLALALIVLGLLCSIRHDISTRTLFGFIAPLGLFVVVALGVAAR